MNEQPRANPARTGRVFMLSWEFELSGEDNRLISRGVTPINCLLQLSQQLGLQANQLADRVCAGLIPAAYAIGVTSDPYTSGRRSRRN